MAEMAEDFLKKFHSLEGRTLGERKRNFYNFLNKYASLKGNENVLDTVSTNLKPETFLEELFRVEILIYFQRVKELFQILKEGNDIFISKIIKQNWFFRETFTEMEAEELVNELLPSMSYTVRMKVLKKLSIHSNPEKFDKIFDAVLTRYGTFVAGKFFLGCSSEKIMKFLEKNKPKLNETQLKFLHKKDAKIIKFLFTEIDYSSHLYPNFFKFLYTEDRPLYNLLDKRHNIDLKLGRRLTKKIVDVKRNDIIAKPLDFIYILNMEAVIRKLGKDSLKLFCNSLPPYKEFSKTDISILRYFSKRYHYNLFFKTIPQHYNIKYVEIPDLIDQQLLDLEPDNKKRGELAKILVKEGQDEYIKYLTLQESIPLIKEKINVTSDIYKRRSLIMDLIETCQINKEPERIFEIMKYFIFRHKNDDMQTFVNFIIRIEDCLDGINFNEEMWTVYFELLKLFILKHEQDVSKLKKVEENPLLKFILSNRSSYQFAYLQYLHKKNIPIEQLLEEMFNPVKYPHWGEFDKDFEKKLLFYIINVVAEKKNQYQKQFHCDIIEQLDLWNQKYPEDRLDFYNFPSLSNSYMSILKEEENIGCFVRDSFRKKIFTTKEEVKRNEYLQIYWQRLNLFVHHNDFRWFFKYNLPSIEKNLENLLEVMTTNTRLPSRTRSFRRRKSNRKSSRIPRHTFNTWYTIKKYSHLHFDRKTIDFCISRLDKEEYIKYRPQYVGCLSVVMKPEEYVALADTYKPTNRKLDLNKAEDVEIYNLQCSIAEKFKYTKAYTVLPSLLNYCKGDYLHHAMESMYSLLYRTPEKELPQHLTYLAKKAVSVRKHALYFTCELATVKEVEDMIKILNETEGVVSLQKYLFSATIKYFVKNPQKEFFDMLMSSMSLITKDDRESHELIIEKYKEIPKEYGGRYFEHAWMHFEKIMENGKDLISLKNKLLIKLQGNDEEVSLEFGLKIIKQHLYPNDESLHLEHIPRFAFYFCKDRKETDMILNSILEVVGNSNSKMSFFRTWYYLIMDCRTDSLMFLQPFVFGYEENIDKIQDFRDYIHVYFLKIRLETPKNSIEKFAEKIFNFMDNVHSEYGSQVVKLFLKELKSQLPHFISYNLYQFYLYLVENRPTSDIVDFVLNEAVMSDRHIRIYNQIIRKIKNIPDEGIQIRLYWSHKDYMQSKKFSL